MLQGHTRQLLLAGLALALAGLTAACESDIQRQMREEKQALQETGELEDLQKQLDTTNPDPYKPGEGPTRNLGRTSRK